jgi:threonine dehydrogenase-like Zn-dependent dehydrogenase
MMSISELHVYRGHQPSTTGFIMGHEFTGAVVEAGSAVKTVQKGDTVVSPFTVSWYVDIEDRGGAQSNETGS